MCIDGCSPQLAVSAMASRQVYVLAAFRGRMSCIEEACFVFSFALLAACSTHLVPCMRRHLDTKKGSSQRLCG
jgi:hypothetical protein